VAIAKCPNCQQELSFPDKYSGDLICFSCNHKSHTRTINKILKNKIGKGKNISPSDGNTVLCPICEESLELPLNYIGVFECPSCKNRFRINEKRKIIKRKKITMQPPLESSKERSDEEKEIFSLTINETKKYLRESKESKESVDNIYYGTCVFLFFIGIGGFYIGINGLVMQSVSIILSCIFSYLSLTYFYQMWNNLSINTSFSNIIDIDRLLKEGLSLEEE
jgi:hypothetical protein